MLPRIWSADLHGTACRVRFHARQAPNRKPPVYPTGGFLLAVSEYRSLNDRNRKPEQRTERFPKSVFVQCPIAWSRQTRRTTLPLRLNAPAKPTTCSNRPTTYALPTLPKPFRPRTNPSVCVTALKPFRAETRTGRSGQKGYEPTGRRHKPATHSGPKGLPENQTTNGVRNDVPTSNASPPSKVWLGAWPLLRWWQQATPL